MPDLSSVLFLICFKRQLHLKKTKTKKQKTKQDKNKTKTNQKNKTKQKQNKKTKTQICKEGEMVGIILYQCELGVLPSKSSTGEKCPHHPLAKLYFCTMLLSEL